MMRQKFKLVEASSAEELTNKVNELLECNWKLSGSIAVTMDVDHVERFYQSLYKDYEQPGAWG